MAAKYLEVQTKPMHREIKLKYLTDLLEELKAFNKTQRAVALANFQIDDTSITLQGTVENIAHMYKE